MNETRSTDVSMDILIINNNALKNKNSSKGIWWQNSVHTLGYEAPLIMLQSIWFKHSITNNNFVKRQKSWFSTSFCADAAKQFLKSAV